MNARPPGNHVTPDAVPKSADLRDRIPLDRVTLKFTRSDGPGGQNVNKVNTRATALLNLVDCAAFSAHELARLRQMLGRRVTSDGTLQVSSSKHRTQRANREAAVERLYELLTAALQPPKPRKKTKTPNAAKRRRLQDKRLVGERKAQRRSTHPAE